MDRRKEAIAALGGTLTANEDLQRAIVRHSIRIERLKNGEASRIRRFFDLELFPDLIGLLTSRLERIKARGFDPGPQRTQRVRDMILAFDGLIEGKMSEGYKLTRDGLIQIAANEGAWQAGMLAKIAPSTVSVVLPSNSTLRAITTSRPFEGRLLSDWFGGLSQGLKTQTKSAVATGIAEGEGTAEITRRVRRAISGPNGISGTRAQIEGVTRTAVNHVTTHARQETYKSNDDIIKGWVFSATLDDRTTLECSGLDGTEWPLNEGPIPPRHIGCRSADFPLLKSWRELGFELDDVPLSTRRKYNGEVPGTFTFDEFLRGESPQFQREYLGRERFKLYQTGRIAVDKFTDSQGRTLSLDQLRAREPDIYAAAQLLGV